jgi:hypothetical protein
METILILIGLIAVCWFLSKAFTKIGNCLNGIGNAMARRDISRQFINHVREQRKILERIEDVNQKIDTLDEAHYQARVHKEIDELTG